jgi:thiamine biosynthesis lipoprotein
MFPQFSTIAGILFLAASLATAQPDTSTQPQPMRMTIPVFGTDAEVEIRDLSSAAGEEAARAALLEIFQISALVNSASGGLSALNAAAGQGPQTVDPRLSEMILRSLQFCIWSGGAYGPLGGELYRLWDEQQDNQRPPATMLLRAALGSSECNRIVLPEVDAQGAGNLVELANNSRVDLRGIVRGFAIDRAIDVLKQHGSQNAWVEIGNVVRAMGPGPEGEGWLYIVPPAPGHKDPIDRLWLQDQAVVILSSVAAHDEPFRVVLDLRTGVPSRGVISVVTITTQAVDAEPLASILFVYGHREGQRRLGTLDPRPAVYWLLGSGDSDPLEASYRWSTIERVR